MTAADDRDVVRWSKRLSTLLRHRAGKVGLAMDPAGWDAIDDVLTRLALGRQQLDEAVARNDKGRLQVDGDRVRACQGHSLTGMPVTLDALEASWERVAPTASMWHGTRADLVERIRATGLHAGGRTHVHLAEAPGSPVGRRSQVDVLLEVDPAALAAAGIAVHRAPNGVLLARAVPPAAIVGVGTRT